VGLAVFDEHLRYLRINDLMAEMNGMPASEHIGKTPQDVIPDVSEQAEAFHRQILETGDPVLDIELTGITPAQPGVVRTWIEHWLPLKDAAGSVIGINVVADEITERRRSEEALRQVLDGLELLVGERTAELQTANAQLREENEERLRTEQALRLEGARLDALLHLSQLGHASPGEMAGFTLEHGIALTGSKIGFVGFLSEDEAIYTLHAVSKDVVKECKVAGDPLQWHVDEAGIWADAIRQRRTLFVNHYHQPQSSKRGLPPGHLPVERLMVVPLFDDGRIVAVAGMGNKASAYDTSDERQIALLLRGMWGHVQRQRAQEALIEAERLAVVGRLAASVAHEVNNPLQAVIGCLGLATEALDEGQDAAPFLDVALGELKRAARTVRQMRDLGRREEGPRELAGVGELVESVLVLTRKQAQYRQVEVTWEAADSLTPVPIVRDHIQQVFLNLVLNAIDAMPTGGALRIQAVQTEEPAGVRVSFADTGVGIASEEVDRVFEAFHSTKEQGLGLGLYVSRNIVQEHGGRIDVESTPGRGTTFTVWLPAESE
jgi:PAS domain S-box-containing protein